MPERQQTEGDFGLRPVKPQQQITDTYSQPTLPKPDLSVLEGIGKLSDTAFEVMDFYDRREKFQRKAGEELGKAQPDFKIGKGSTEAAMVGFKEGRGTALGSMFQQEVESNWKVAVENNERLLEDENSYQLFHGEQMNEFIQRHQIEGLSVPKFLEGQETYLVQKSADHAVASLKHKRKIFINDSKEVTSSSLASGTQYAQYVNSLTNEQVYEATTNLTTGKEGEHLLGSFAAYMRGEGDENYSSADMARRRASLKTQYAMDNTNRIQGMLESANASGMNTLQEVEAHLIEDFIKELKDGTNPDMAYMTLSNLTTGTALFMNRPAVQSALLENKEAIELNMFNRRVSEEQSMDWFSATKVIHPEWTDAKWEEVILDLEAVPITSERIALREKVLLNWERSIAARDSKTHDESIAVGQAQELMLTGNFTLDDINAQTGVPKNKLNRMAEAQVLATLPLNLAGGYNPPEAAKAFMDFVGTQQQFADATFIKTGAMMSTSAYTATTTNPNYEQIKQGFELYRAMKNANVSDRFKISPLAESVYGFILSEERKDEQSLDQIIQRVYYEAALVSEKSVGFTIDDTFEVFKDTLGDGGWFGLTPDVAPTRRQLRLLGDQLHIKIQGGLTKEQAANEIIDEWEELGIRSFGDNESERLWQYTKGSDFDYEVMEQLDEYVAETIKDEFDRGDKELDPYRKKAIELLNTQVKVGTAINLKGVEVDVMESEKEEWERGYEQNLLDRHARFGSALFDEDYKDKPFVMSAEEKLQMEQEWEKIVEQRARQEYFEDKGMYPLDSQGLRFDNYFEAGDGFWESAGGLIIDLAKPTGHYQGIATRLNLDGDPTYYIAQYVKRPDGEWYAIPLPDKLIERLGFDKFAKDGETKIYENNFTADELTNSSWGNSYAQMAYREAQRKAAADLAESVIQLTTPTDRYTQKVVNQAGAGLLDAIIKIPYTPTRPITGASISPAGN